VAVSSEKADQLTAEYANASTDARKTIVTRLQLPTPLELQKDFLYDPARFKMWRAGRRVGKSRAALIAASVGHGPEATPGDPASRMWRGMAQGGDIIWLAPDYGQSDVIWEEEIIPRFKDKLGVNFSEKNRTIRVGLGSLKVRSAENINRLRGGENDGVVFDEAAFFKLAHAWRRVIRPTLANRRGWAMFISSTEIGSDFNSLIGEVEDDEAAALRDANFKRKRPNYKAWHTRTRDNPLITPEELEELSVEFPPGSAEELQELAAELLERLGDLFKEAYFHYYDQANPTAMWIHGVRFPFVELEIYADLATSLKETADYTAFTVAGLTAGEGVSRARKAGLLEIVNERIEAPDQITRLISLVETWQPARVLIESTQYQLSAVQHLKRALETRRNPTRVEPYIPKGDKRERAVGFAAAMSRADVYWPSNVAWAELARKQLLKFPHGKESSKLPEDHDDIVDTLSMLGKQLERASWRPYKIKGR